MKLYFDTNVYSYIARHGAEAKVRAMLDRHRHSVVASTINLGETWRAPESDRIARMRAIAVVAKEITKYPDSYYQAQGEASVCA